MNKGFTLIETIIYIGLFAIVIGGGMIATYAVIQAANAGNNHIVVEEEANFLLRKVNWALTGASAYTIVNSPASLSVTKSGYPTLKFDVNSGNLELARGANSAITLNSSNFKVTSLSFTNAASGNGVTTNFTLQTVLNGETITESFTTTKYLRQ